MSFDTEPERRYLLHKEGVKYLFESHSESQAMEFLDQEGVTDVTGIPEYELLFKQQTETIISMIKTSKSYCYPK